jgi:class 3 adenylate cyclase/TolB-like protein/Tfp pilus assembly protein PilF
MEGEYKLIAVMFTDVVGYTELSHRNEALALQLLQEHNAAIRPILARHSGREIKTIGDAFLIEFDSALRALQCAIEIQARFEAQAPTAAEPEPKRFRLRISIHVGDVVASGGDIYGNGVNVASRLLHIAPPGGICVSYSVFEQVRNKTKAKLEFAGKRKLKGIDERVAIFIIPPSTSATQASAVPTLNRLSPFTRATAAVLPFLVAASIHFYRQSQQHETTAASVDHRRIAILPFENIGSNQADEYLSDGLTEELITQLSRVDAVRVMARGSILQYKGTKKTPSEISKELRTPTLVQGTVSKVGEQLHVNVQLVDGTSQENLWSQEFDGKLEDVLTIQKNIASKISGEVGGASRSPASVPNPTNAESGVTDKGENGEAYVHYLRGRYFLDQRTDSSFQKAFHEFEEAARLDPKSARAYGALANVTGLQLYYGGASPQDADPKIRAFAHQALDIDPTNAEALLALAAQAMNFDGDRPEAEARYKQALVSNFRNPTAHQWYADFLIRSGRKAESYAEADEAVRLDPLSLVTNVASGVMRYFGGDIDESIKLINATLEMDSNFMLGHYWLGRALIEKQQYTAAVAELKHAAELSEQNPMMLAALAQAKFLAGNTDEAKAIIKTLTSLKNRFVSQYDLAIAYSGSKDAGETISQLKGAVNQKISRFSFASVDPSFAFLRDNAEFKRLTSDQH